MEFTKTTQKAIVMIRASPQKVEYDFDKKTAARVNLSDFLFTFKNVTVKESPLAI